MIPSLAGPVPSSKMADIIILYSVSARRDFMVYIDEELLITVTGERGVSIGKDVPIIWCATL